MANENSNTSDLLSAAEARDRLGVSAAQILHWVNRRWVRPVPVTVMRGRVVGRDFKFHLAELLEAMEHAQTLTRPPEADPAMG